MTAGECPHPRHLEPCLTPEASNYCSWNECRVQSSPALGGNFLLNKNTLKMDSHKLKMYYHLEWRCTTASTVKKLGVYMTLMFVNELEWAGKKENTEREGSNLYMALYKLTIGIFWGNLNSGRPCNGVGTRNLLLPSYTKSVSAVENAKNML